MFPFMLCLFTNINQSWTQTFHRSIFNLHRGVVRHPWRHTGHRHRPVTGWVTWLLTLHPLRHCRHSTFPLFFYFLTSSLPQEACRMHALQLMFTYTGGGRCGYKWEVWLQKRLRSVSDIFSFTEQMVVNNTSCVDIWTKGPHLRLRVP